MNLRAILIDNQRKEIARLRLSENIIDGCEVLIYEGFPHLYSGMDKGWLVFRRVRTYIASAEDTV